MKIKSLNKKLLFSASLILALLIAFILGYLVSSEKWQCPVCSFKGEIVPLVNEQYFNITMNEINSAESSIDIAIYEFKWYETNNSATQIREALVKAHENGVQVRLLLDQSKWYGEVTELSKSNKQTAEYLSGKGISVKLDSEKITTHDKLLIIDNEIVIVGSHNWGSSALTKNNEASVMIKDTKIAEYYENYFEFLWENA